LFFKDDDLIEVDHITSKIKGGKDKWDNLQALHRHCHDEKTASDTQFGTNPVETEPSLSPKLGN
jgi:RNA-directed DNA polymerase